MNYKEYIENGYLELYAQGLLSEEEEKTVSLLLEQHPDMKAELERIQQSLERMSEVYAVPPPAGLKEKISAEIFKAANTAEEEKIVYGNQAELKLIRNYRYAVAASLSLLIVSAVLGLNYRNQWKKAEEQVLALGRQNSELAESINTTRLEAGKMQDEMGVLKNPDFKMCMMKGMPQQPDLMAMVFWNKNTRETYVSIKKLPEAPSGKQYQLWAMVDGKPVDAGVFASTAIGDALQKVKSTENAQAFAVTLEKEGGSPTPSLDHLMLIGNI